MCNPHSRGQDFALSGAETHPGGRTLGAAG